MDEDILAAVGKTRSEFESVGDVSQDPDLSKGDLQDAIYGFMGVLDESETGRHKSRVGVMHASSTSCIRRRWYSFHNVQKQEHDEFPSGISERGNRLEDWVEYALSYHFGEDRVGNEYPVVEEIDHNLGSFSVTGSTDPYVTDEDGNLALLTEVKSTLYPPDEPKPTHVWQLNTYLSILGLDYGFIIYISPSNYENNAIYRIDQDEEQWNLIKFYHALAHYYIGNHKFPPKLPVWPDECAGCSYKGLCVQDNDGLDYVDPE